MYSSNAQPTGTNRPRACPTPHSPTTPRAKRTHMLASTTQNLNQQPTPIPTHQQRARVHHVHNRTQVHRVTAAIATGKHPDPSRTRKLSQPAPMVLHPTGCGRVGRRRTYFSDGGHLRVAPIAIVGPVAAPEYRAIPRSEQSRGRRSSQRRRPAREIAVPAASGRAEVRERLRDRAGPRSAPGTGADGGPDPRPAGRAVAGRRRARRKGDWSRPADRAACRAPSDQATVRRPAAARGDHRHGARPLGDAASSRGCPRSWPLRVARHLAAAGDADRQRPGDGLPAHPGGPGPRLAARGGARGDRRGGVRGRPLRRGAGRAARRQADERRDGVPADHGRLPPRPRPAGAGAQAGQEPRRSRTSRPRPRPR